VEKPLTLAAATKAPVSSKEKPAEPTGEAAAQAPAAEASKEAEAVIFAAKSLMWLAAEKETVQPEADKEQDALGKKLAARIKELAGKEMLYLEHPEDAANLLQIWARYGSRNETGRYLAETFKNRPDNAIRFIKCYLPPDAPTATGDPAALFTRDSYKAISQVIDPDKVYAALTKVFKFKLDSIEETTTVKPADRNIAFKFMRFHLQEKA